MKPAFEQYDPFPMNLSIYQLTSVPNVRSDWEIWNISIVNQFRVSNFIGKGSMATTENEGSIDPINT